METIQSVIDLIKRHAYQGLIFKSGEDFYTVHQISDVTVTVYYFNSTEEIPFELFYKILNDENYSMILSWKNMEAVL